MSQGARGVKFFNIKKNQLVLEMAKTNQKTQTYPKVSIQNRRKNVK